MAAFLKAAIDLGYFIFMKSSLYVFYVFSGEITQLHSGKHSGLETPKEWNTTLEVKFFK